MSTSHWEKLQSLFERALGQPHSEREAWLEQACEGDASLRDEVLELLAADAGEDDVLQQVVDQSVLSLQNSNQPDSGTSIGPWRILRELGSGGMGSVYLAERADTEYRRQVAIKLIRGFPDALSLERLRIERQILADLDHPNIAAMIDGGTTGDGQPYLVLQYIDGQRLDQWCHEARPSRSRCLALMERVCTAVEYAHRKLVIHRDLKPGNVLVTDQDQPILLDFGIAKLAEVESESESESESEPVQSGGITRSGRYYTPGFSAPEQLRGESVSTLADVYGLGRLLEWLLKTEPTLPRELAAIIAQATAQAPGDRYASVAALREDLQRFRQGLPVVAAPARFGYRFGKFLARHKLAASATALALVVGIGLISRIVIEGERAQLAEAEARLEAANANQVLDFIVDMIDAAGPARARGQEVRVLDVIELARERTNAQAIDDPALRARLLFALGRLYRTVESHVPAMELLEESAHLARETGDPVTEIQALSMLGVSAVLNDEIERGRAALEQAMAVSNAHPELDPLLHATALNNYGIYLNESDRYDEAREAFERSLALRQAANAPDRTIATSFHNLGEVEDLSGRPAEAREYYYQALALKERSIGRLHLSYALSLNGVSMTSAKLGEPETVRQALEEQLEIRQTLLGEDHHSLYRSYNELAGLEHDLGRMPEAIKHYQRAQELDARSPGGAQRDWLFTNNMGAAYRDWGLLDRAEALFRESLRLRIVRFGPEDLATQRVRHNLANVLYLRGRLGDARTLVDHALSARRERLDEGHPDILRSEVLSGLIGLAETPEDADPASIRAGLTALANALSDNNYSVLVARGQFGRALIELGDYRAARAELQDVQHRLVESLNPDHTVSLAYQLDLARLDLLQGRDEQASERLNLHGDALIERFPADSIYLRQFHCLREASLDPECWAGSEP